MRRMRLCTHQNTKCGNSNTHVQHSMSTCALYCCLTIDGRGRWDASTVRAKNQRLRRTSHKARSLRGRWGASMVPAKNRWLRRTSHKARSLKRAKRDPTESASNTQKKGFVVGKTIACPAVPPSQTATAAYVFCPPPPPPLMYTIVGLGWHRRCSTLYVY